MLSSVALLLPAIVTTGVVALATAPAALAAAPTPLPPTLLWTENFENGTGATPVALVGGYTGQGGVTYTANNGWQNPDNCNGIVLNAESTGPFQRCGLDAQDDPTPSMDNLRLLSTYIGERNGSANPAANHVVAAYTDGAPPQAGIMAQTITPVTLDPGAQSNRFITASVWVAAGNCNGAGDPLLQFEWSADGTTWNSLGATVEVCELTNVGDQEPPLDPNTPGAQTVVAQAYANGGSLQSVSTNSIYVRVSNMNPDGNGNDMAWDDLSIYEGSPVLTKQFDFSSIDIHPDYIDFSTLKFLFTNSADLSAKTGLGFNDILPAGVSIDDPLYVTNDCEVNGTPTGTVTAIPGGNAIAISGVTLPYGVASCEIAIDVTSSAVGIYTNNNTNITSPRGLIPNTNATLTVADGAPPGAGATDDARSGPYNQPLAFTPLANDSAGTPTSPYTASSINTAGTRLCDVAPNAETPPNCTQTLVFTDDGDYELDPATGVVVFTPNPGFTGVAEPVRYQMRVNYTFGPNSSDLTDHREFFDATINPTIGPPPPPPSPVNPPIAKDDSESTPVNTPVSAQLGVNDTYPAGSTFSKASEPANGQAVVNPDGSYTYTPAKDFVGVDSFRYRVCLPAPNAFMCAQATATITVGGPVARDDFESTPVNTPVSAELGVNDTYPAGSTFAKVSNPAHGQAVVNPDGSYTYTPAKDFVGVDSFKYKVCLPAPNAAVCAEATATITVGGPVAKDDFEYTPVNTPVSAQLGVNDTYPAGSTFAKVSNPANGQAVVNPDGSYTYTPAKDFVGVDSFKYKVCLPAPNAAVCAEATATITVGGPIARDDFESTPINTPVSAQLGVNDTYPPGSTFTRVSNPSNGRAVVNPDGSYTYTPAKDFVGVDSFKYKVCLPAPNATVCAQATATITVGGPVAKDDVRSTPINTPVSAKLGRNDTYPPGSTFARVSNPSNGRAVVNPDGSYTYTPAKDFVGVDSFRYKVCLPAPNAAVCAEATATITVGGPTARDDFEYTPINTPVSAQLGVNDTYPAGSTFAKVSNPSNGQAVVNPDGSYTYTPAKDFVGVDSFKYKVCLPAPKQAVCAEATATITVGGPIARDDAETTPLNTAVSAKLGVNDTYPRGSTFAKVSDPSNGRVVVNADGSYTYTPAKDFVGVDSFKYKVCLPAPHASVCAQATVTITVAGVTPVATPVLQRVPILSVVPLMYAPQANVSVGSLEIAKKGTREWGRKVKVPGKGVWVLKGDEVMFRPDPDFLGRTTIRYRVVDANGQVAHSTFTAVALAKPSDIHGGRV